MCKIINEPPLVSIILPYYKAEKTLHKAVESITNQTYKNWELILVNNNPNPNDYFENNELIKKVNPLVKFIYEPEKGVAKAFNKGLKYAKGKYIARMDADDTMTPIRIEHQVRFLENNMDFGLVGGKAIYGNQILHGIGMKDFVEWNNSILTYDEIILNRFIESPIINPTVTFRHSILKQFGSYKTDNLPEDYELYLRLLDNGVRIAKIDEPVLEWNDSETRLTRKHNNYSTEAFYKVKSEYLAKWLVKQNPFHPNVWIWGAGRVSRKRASLLLNHHIKIKGYIDLNTTKFVSGPTIHYSQIPRVPECFILSYVSNRGARQKIRDYLESISFKEGIKFICAA